MSTPISALIRTNEAARAAAPASPTMDRDGFLKLLVAQLSHQDPLQPTEGTEFVTQLSQFALVEQSITQSNQLNVISTQVRGLSNNEAAGLVGQTVTIRGHGVAFDGAAATTSNVQLGAAAGRVTATLRDAHGRVVRTMDIGARQTGALAVRWDGRDDSGQTVPRGTYSLTVTAMTVDDREVTVTHDVTGTVTRVSFDQGYPELTLDSGASAPISDLVNISRAAPRTP
ncbi:MAG: flagellar hook assembly protein FlgD [Deltaproteobacteria bacterium]|nr:flagellar hook assembly protein FlgD [Myxococcales bacterium]MDP3218397.1 flagellar hook assembly protein FlgD [Deltaproteobacteria bacterium]